MRRLRDESGFTLIELLMAMTLMLIILGTVITVFTGFQTTSLRNRQQSVANDQARNGIDRVARDMRNQATPTKDLPTAILYAQPQDVAFITVGQTKPAGSLNTRNLMRVRYCLNTTTRTLWKQTQTWQTATPASEPPGGQPCPGNALWQTQDPLVTDVTNGARAVFAYDPASGWTSTADIRTIDTTLYVDADPNQKPSETRLNTSVRLRNQNHAPIADFDGKPAGDRHVLLIAGAEDQDGQSPLYTWTVDGQTITTCNTAICDYGPDDTPPATSGNHTFGLDVSDPSDLYAPNVTRSVTVP